MSLFFHPEQFFANTNGTPYAGAKLNFYEPGTSTRKDTYSDTALSVAHENPVVADADGKFAPIYLNGTYKVVFTASDDTEIYTVNEYGSGSSQEVDDYAELRTITPVSERVVYVKYGSTAGDGAHGHFRGVTGAAAGTYTDNGGTIIVPTGGDGSAAWLREYSGAVNVRWFGATGDGTTADDTAFANLRSYCVANGEKAYLPAGSYRLTDTWTVGTTGTGSYDGFDIEGDGQEVTEILLDFTGDVGVDINPGSGGYTAFANASVGGFRIRVASGEAVTVPLYIKNSYNCNYHDIHIYVPSATVAAEFVGVRVSGACYFNTYRNLWVEAYSGDPAAGKAFYVGNGLADIGLAGGTTSINLFLNCRTRGFAVGFDTVYANDTTYINCDAEVCTYSFRDLSTTGTQYINCWEEGATTTGVVIDRTDVFQADGTTATASGSDYTQIHGGFWSDISIDHAYRTRIRARYNSLTTTANTEECDSDSLNTSATHAGDTNDVTVRKRLTSPVAYTVTSLGNRRYGYEFPNAADAKFLWFNSSNDIGFGAYRDDGAGAWRGWQQYTNASGAWVLSSWFTGAAVGSESPNALMTGSVSNVSFGVLPRPTTDSGVSCGEASGRWSEVFAATGTINTSDAREKTSVAPLTTAELEAAKVISREIGTYQWLSAVAEKGSEARHHVGMTVQRAIEIMQTHGLDPFAYGFICYDQWEEETDLDGNVIQEAGDRYSFRPDELLMFIARGIDARLAALEGV